jgi:hypothetical protein
MADRNAQKLTTSELAGYDAPAKEPEAMRPELIKQQEDEARTQEELVRTEKAGELEPRPEEMRERPSRIQEMRPREVTPHDRPMPLFKEAELADFRAQWVKVQTGFVDEPRQTVQDADQLVASVMQRLAQGFADERAGLEKQWSQGENVSTEDLRLGLQKYRSFFDRLLSL